MYTRSYGSRPSITSRPLPPDYGGMALVIPQPEAEPTPPPRPEPTAKEIEALRTAAKAYLPARVEHYAAIMGLTPASVKITSAKRRFGSCSGRNGICFSLYLMQYPPEAIDYVVVHELAHIRHKNHSAAFHALVAKYLPDHKARRAMLKGAGRNQDEAGNS